MSLNAIIHRKIYRPCREISQNGGSQTAIHASKAIVVYDRLDSLCIDTKTRSDWAWGQRDLTHELSLRIPAAPVLLAAPEALF